MFNSLKSEQEYAQVLYTKGCFFVYMSESCAFGFENAIQATF